MNMIRPFEFDRRFDLEGLAAAEAAKLLEREAADREELDLVSAEHEAMKSIARADGFDAGVEYARKERAAELERIGERFTSVLEQSLARAAEFHDQVTLDAIALAVAIGQGLAGELIKNSPLACAETTIAKALAEHFDRPRFTVKVATGDLSTLQEFVNRQVDLVAYEGRMVLQADPQLAAGDCIIEWPDGGIRSIMSERRDRVVGHLVELLSARIANEGAEFSPGQGNNQS